MGFILSTFVSTAATFLAVPSRSEWENWDRLETLVWFPPLDQDWREEPLVYVKINTINDF